MSARKVYPCPNCGRNFFGQQNYVRHLLEEAGQRGVTTSEFLRWGAGSRFGARVHELRHDFGLFITEENELYTLVAGPAARTRLGDRPSVPDGHDGVGCKNLFEHVYLCRRCAYKVFTTPRCPKGHQCVRGWYADFTVQQPAVRAA